MKRFAAIVLAVLLLVSPGDPVSAKESWEDAAMAGVVSLMLASLPPDVKVTYDQLSNNRQQRTFEVKGLSVVRTLKGKVGTGTLDHLHVSGVDALSALSGKPFTAERIDLTKLDIDECGLVGKKAPRRCRWSAKTISIEDAEVPSFIALAQAGGDPEQAFQSLHFSRAVIDGTVVHTVPEALARIRRKK